jgi:CBS domain-containing protein
MKNLLKLARTPPVVLSKGASVSDAVRKMVRAGVGVAVVVDHGHAIGVFTERDAVARVLLEERPPRTTRVGDVMTAPIVSVTADTDPHEARQTMMARGVRHLVVVDDEAKVLGVLSLRHVMAEEIDDLEHEIEGLASYDAVDSIGG